MKSHGCNHLSTSLAGCKLNVFMLKPELAFQSAEPTPQNPSGSGPCSWDRTYLFSSAGINSRALQVLGNHPAIPSAGIPDLYRHTELSTYAFEWSLEDLCHHPSILLSCLLLPSLPSLSPTIYSAYCVPALLDVCLFFKDTLIFLKSSCH